jgi:hypothetical protein
MAVSDIARRAAERILPEHHGCEDCYYSCPLHPDYCGDKYKECDCGLELRRAGAAIIIQAAMDEYGHSVRCAHETAANS